ncbi:hypothetical protein BE17_12630 [Sorangium cellulosum]|uniref:Uncharacterized protein n=1 Tax=Sorangium cellulosum TaxID=56 RepID=A0A150R431_SORCE|nr:hypothetical protein BE17_12630 [Sorangium cellulosum]
MLLLVALHDEQPDQPTVEDEIELVTDGLAVAHDPVQVGGIRQRDLEEGLERAQLGPDLTDRSVEQDLLLGAIAVRSSVGDDRLRGEIAREGAGLLSRLLPSRLQRAARDQQAPAHDTHRAGGVLQS